jgi:uncharacterized small protein (DUF1192 family)
LSAAINTAPKVRIWGIGSFLSDPAAQSNAPHSRLNIIRSEQNYAADRREPGDNQGSEAMGRHDEDDSFAPVPKPPEHVLGQLLDDLSIEELKLRIEALKTEIARLEEAQRAKAASQASAAAFFKPAS